jgi:hypothetical protein
MPNRASDAMEREIAAGLKRVIGELAKDCDELSDPLPDIGLDGLQQGRSMIQGLNQALAELHQKLSPR